MSNRAYHSCSRDKKITLMHNMNVLNKRYARVCVIMQNNVPGLKSKLTEYEIYSLIELIGGKLSIKHGGKNHERRHKIYKKMG